MQVAANGDKYNERVSKDDPKTSFTIDYNAAKGEWCVCCWRGLDNHWVSYFYDKVTGKERAEKQALDLFNKFV